MGEASDGVDQILAMFGVLIVIYDSKYGQGDFINRILRLCMVRYVKETLPYFTFPFIHLGGKERLFRVFERFNLDADTRKFPLGSV